MATTTRDRQRTRREAEAFEREHPDEAAALTHAFHAFRVAARGLAEAVEMVTGLPADATDGAMRDALEATVTAVDSGCKGPNDLRQRVVGAAFIALVRFGSVPNGTAPDGAPDVLDPSNGASMRTAR